MSGIQLSASLARDLERDAFGSFIASRGKSLVLVEIELSNVETQAYVVDLNRHEFYVENTFWADAQSSILAAALSEVKLPLKDIPILSRKTILAGVWHFGHLIGDHAHRLVTASRQSNKLKYLKPIHLCINTQCEDWIFDTLFLHEKLFVSSNSEVSFAGSRVRVYALDDCICFFPADDKSIPLSIASEHVRLNIQGSSFNESSSLKIFLTSQRASRIINSDALCAFLRSRGWEIINPTEMQNQAVLSKVANAHRLISENGSILFNCFLARSSPYLVLCSQRSTSYLEGDAWAGGGVYNYFHKGVLVYFPCKAIVENHHPFSDAIWVDIESLDVALNSPAFAGG